jgi:hypothetical protein
MSAYIVEKKHILYLVEAAMSRTIAPSGVRYLVDGEWLAFGGGACDTDSMVRIGNMLWRENVASVLHRYPDSKYSHEDYQLVKSDVRATGTTFAPDQFAPPQVLKAIHCYKYQSCEHEGWKRSAARGFVRALEACAMRAVDGYDAAVWGAPEPKRRKGLAV